MNKSWEYKKIGDVCIVERGGSPRPIDKFITEDEDGINWIKIGDTSDSMYITETAQKIIPEGMKKSRYVKPGDFLLSNSMSFGRPYILKIDGCIHDGWLVLRDEQELFDKRFLYYYLSSKATYEKFKSMAVGGVVNNLNSEMVRKVDVPVPSKGEQEDIADLLDRLKTVIDSRKEELQLLDDLIKARFVELFGNIKEEKLLGEISEFVTVGIANSATHAYAESGIPMLRNQNIRENYLDDSDLIYIKPEFAAKYESKKLKENDIIAMRTGYPGVACLVPKKYEGCQTFTTLIVRLKEDNNPSYVCSYINSDLGKRFIDSEKVGVAQQNVGAKSLAQMPIKIAPKELQDEYAAFVKQVDKSKVAVQKALDETQLLFDSLMQQYFG